MDSEWGGTVMEAQELLASFAKEWDAKKEDGRVAKLTYIQWMILEIYSNWIVDNYQVIEFRGLDE